MFEGAIGTALCFIFLFSYLDVRKLAGYALIVDITVFALFLWMFQGTHTGMMTGIIAGLCITLYLKGVRKTLGYKKLRLVRMEGELWPRMRWQQFGGITA